MQAADNFDVAASPTLVFITVEDSSEVLPGVSSETLSTSVLIVILVLFSTVAIIAVISLSRRGKQGDKNNDRFGLVVINYSDNGLYLFELGTIKASVV